MADPAPPLGDLSSVGGMLSSNSGVLALAAMEKRLHVAERLAG